MSDLRLPALIALAVAVPVGVLTSYSLKSYLNKNTARKRDALVKEVWAGIEEMDFYKAASTLEKARYRDVYFGRAYPSI